MRRIAFALGFGLAACATSGPEVPALVEIEAAVPPAASDSRQGIYLVTVTQDGSVARRLHHWGGDEPLRRSEPERLSPEQIGALRDVLATPVAVDQSAVPLEATEFRVTAHGSPEWKVECYEHEVYRCPIPFVKLWQSLDEIIGDLPGH